MLYRLGINAYLTLGNKKSVDIIVEKVDGSIVTIDVKGLAGKTAWPVDNISKRLDYHFIIFVCYNEKISDVSSIPDCFIVPSSQIDSYIYENPNKTRKVVELSRMRKFGEKHKDNWQVFK